MSLGFLKFVVGKKRDLKRLKRIFFRMEEISTLA